ESLDALSFETLREFHHRHYVPRNATLLVVGAFDPVEVEKLVRDHFSDWKSAPLPPAPSEDDAKGRAANLAVVDPGAEQVAIRIVFPIDTDIDGASPELLARHAHAAARRLREKR